MSEDATAARCAQCGAPAAAGQRFCEQCGSTAAAGRDRVELDMRLAGTALAGGVSDRGHRRQRNEDAMACGHVHLGGAGGPAGAALGELGELGEGSGDGGRGEGLAVVAVVCDGVASVQRGDEAAQAAARTASQALLATLAGMRDADLPAATGDAAREAAGAVAALAHTPNGAARPSDTRRAGAPSSTFVSAVVTADEVVVGWVGDSRAYWLGEHPSLLTRDHALGGVLTRWLGADAGEVRPQVAAFRPDGPGVVMLCSDGLWNYLPEPGDLAAVALPAGREQPFTAAAELAQHALDAGGRDNVTVVVVPFPPSTG